MSTTATPSVAAEIDQWLSRFGEALARGDSDAAAELFAEESFWRDLVAFTWNIKTVEGRAGVRDMLEHTLAHIKPRGWHTTEEPTAADGVSEAWIAFETEVGRGRGHLRLIAGQAWTLLTTLEELKGHEESAGAHRPQGVEGLGSNTAKDPGPWEGEQRNMWKPTQQEGLWFHGGNLHQSRHYSLYLALQLKARAEGMDTPVFGLQEIHHVR